MGYGSYDGLKQALLITQDRLHGWVGYFCFILNNTRVRDACAYGCMDGVCDKGLLTGIIVKASASVFKPTFYSWIHNLPSLALSPP